jgi:hypothetical protein
MFVCPGPNAHKEQTIILFKLDQNCFPGILIVRGITFEFEYCSQNFEFIIENNLARKSDNMQGKSWKNILRSYIGAHVQWGRNIMLLSQKTTQLLCIIYRVKKDIEKRRFSI